MDRIHTCWEKVVWREMCLKLAASTFNPWNSSSCAGTIQWETPLCPVRFVLINIQETWTHIGHNNFDKKELQRKQRLSAHSLWREFLAKPSIQSSSMSMAAMVSDGSVEDLALHHKSLQMSHLDLSYLPSKEQRAWVRQRSWDQSWVSCWQSLHFILKDGLLLMTACTGSNDVYMVKKLSRQTPCIKLSQK